MGDAVSLRIAEIFTSIQGEGSWVGIPSTFVRVSGCNLRCVWCDTPYASWNPEGPVRRVDDLLGEIAQRGVRHVVVTGGEPMLFDATEALCEGLRARGHVITIETAGTAFRALPCDLMSISPKLANSAPPGESGWRERHESTRANRAPLRQLLDAYACQLKFVVRADRLDADLAEIDEVLAELPPMEPERILLMAEGTDSQTQLVGQRALVDVCLARGWRLTPRMHIDLFGNTRGT